MDYSLYYNHSCDNVVSCRNLTINPLIHKTNFRLLYPQYDSRLSDPNQIEESDSNSSRSIVDYYKKKNTAKGGYIVSTITKELFELEGSKPFSIDPRIHFINKTYSKGNVHQESCALIGIPVSEWSDLLTDDSLLIRNLRKSPELSHILDIKQLTSIHVVDIILKFKHLFRQYEHDLILVNIEPKGLTGQLEKAYPIPRISIPGGGMETNDLNSFESCAFREFREETGLNIIDRHIKISQDFIFKKRHSRELIKKQDYKYSSGHYNNNNFIQKKDIKKTNEKNYIGIVYMVKIVTEEDKLLYDFETGKLTIIPPPGLFFT